MSPAIREIALKDSKQYTELAEKARNSPGIVPLFLKSPDGVLHIIPSFFRESGEITEGFKLVYMGNSLSDGAEKETEKVLTLPAGAS
jgi:hypothetical protein